MEASRSGEVDVQSNTTIEHNKPTYLRIRSEWIVPRVYFDALCVTPISSTLFSIQYKQKDYTWKLALAGKTSPRDGKCYAKIYVNLFSFHFPTTGLEITTLVRTRHGTHNVTQVIKSRRITDPRLRQNISVGSIECDHSNNGDQRWTSLLDNNRLHLICNIEGLADWPYQIATCPQVVDRAESGESSYAVQLLESGRKSDLTIKVQDETFSVHTILLAVKSPVFAAMFNGDFKEANNQHELDIQDIFGIHLHWEFES